MSEIVGWCLGILLAVPYVALTVLRWGLHWVGWLLVVIGGLLLWLDEGLDSPRQAYRKAVDRWLDRLIARKR